MSYSPHQGSPSLDSYPQSGKPFGGYGGEDPLQRDKSRHQKQQQQASPVRVLPQGHLPESNNPDKQSSHQNSHHHQQQQSIPPGVPSSSGYAQKDHYPESHSSLPGYQSSHNQTHQQQPVRVLAQGYNPKHNDLSNHQSLIQSHKQVITSIQDPSPQKSIPKDSSTTHRLPSESSSKTQKEPTTEEVPVKQRNPSESSGEGHRDPPKNPNPTSFGVRHLSQTKDHTNGSEQKQNPPRERLPIPEGYPPPRPPTSPSRLEPRPKKRLLEKICRCFF